MFKFLVTSEVEYMELFSDWEYNRIEKFLDIEIPNNDGLYQSDDDTVEEYADNLSVFRKRDEEQFPSHYPCVVLLICDSTFDRTGDLTIELLLFVYESDFNSESTEVHVPGEDVKTIGGRQ